MNTVLRIAFLGVIAACLGTRAIATAPAIGFAPDSFYLGTQTSLTAIVSDPEGNMTDATFEVLPKGSSTWTALPSVPLKTVAPSAQQSGVAVGAEWRPESPGLWSVRITVTDALQETNSVTRTIDVIAGTRTINPVTIASGSSQMFSHEGELITADANPGVVVQSGGNLVLWAGGRIQLKPGFHAENGSFFWAAIDHDMNGYSDIEETQQNFIPGVPDAWVADQMAALQLVLGRDPIPFTAAQAVAAFRGGYKPTDSTATVTSTYPVVLKLPTGGYYGLDTSTWSLTGIGP